MHKTIQKILIYQISSGEQAKNIENDINKLLLYEQWEIKNIYMNSRDVSAAVSAGGEFGNYKESQMRGDVIMVVILEKIIVEKESDNESK